MEQDAAGSGQYWAFISYSHKDTAFARRLHHRLESYALPRRLVGRSGAHGTVPRRIAPIFRDRDELSAAQDLSTEVRAALKASRSLVIVCSPAAAASHWVSREIEVFRALNPGAPILGAIRSGEPDECFPRTLVAPGSDGGQVEPLAADFRRGQDGEHLGLLKLVAGIAGLRLDELIQRDASRRYRRVTAITAVALAVALMMGVSALLALQARGEAERQRGEAEGLIEFMLTDLRDRLKGVGRLDVMSAVNERALHYYVGEDLARLSVDSLERRARILHAMGEDDETRGDHDAALAKFHEAWRTTEALLAEAPGDPERIFDHAQSEGWVGIVDYNRGNYPAAQSMLRDYKRLAERLVAIDPHNAKYRLQLGEADSDLCAVTVDGHTASPAAAVRYCKDALALTEQATRGAPLTAEAAANILDRHAWLADAYLGNGQVAQAKAERLTEERILNAQIAADPRNMDLKDTWVVLQRALARIEVLEGHKDAALARLTRALAVSDQMIRFDPANKQWGELRADLAKEMSQLQRSMNQGDRK